MSGRSGYRKTDRKVQARRTAAEMPDYRLSFHLPGMLHGTLQPGPTKVIGVEIKQAGRVEVVSKDRDWVLRQAAAFLDGIAGPQELIVTATLTRGGEPSPTLCREVRRGYRVSHEFVLVRGPAIIIAQPNDRPIVLPAKRA